MLKEAVLKELSSIIHPATRNNIVSENVVHDVLFDGDTCRLSLDLSTIVEPVRESLKSLVIDAAKRVNGVDAVELAPFVKGKQNPLVENDKSNLDQVKHIIAVSSCKGGVGKSTVSVNLAMSLKLKGYQVGILDADIYGPSLPTMIQTNEALTMDGDELNTLDFHGLKCMSFGYALNQADQDGPAILRGPMVSQIVQQFLLQTKWGELDYLIIDMPPGTGDIQLTLCQIAPLSAAVIVTTPQQISFIDVVKGIEMFDKLNVPVVAAVENMSYLTVNGDKLRPFGKGALDKLIHEFGFEHTVALSLDDAVSRCGDTGKPFVVAEPNNENSKKLEQLAEAVVHEIDAISSGNSKMPKIGYNPKDGVIIHYDGEEPFFIDAKTLRLDCRSALTRDEFTGEMKVTEQDVPDDIHPFSMNPVGNYALVVNWSDGAASLYPYKQLDKFRS